MPSLWAQVNASWPKGQRKNNFTSAGWAHVAQALVPAASRLIGTLVETSLDPAD
jgi:hypothetical protein